jgi:hypothetical protein
MEHTPKRYLFILTYTNSQTEPLIRQVRHYQRLITIAQHESPRPAENFLLLVFPQLPAQYTWLLNADDRLRASSSAGILLLKRLGDVLHIPKTHRYAGEGSANWNGWRLARQLNVDEIYGYSPGFARCVQGWQHLRHTMSTAIKHPPHTMPQSPMAIRHTTAPKSYHHGY